MRIIAWFCFFIGIISISNAQPISLHKTRGGLVSLGLRTTYSSFNDGSWSNAGSGTGGQFRVQVSDRLNTDWYFDYITGNISDYAHRDDYHIGWSVLFYLRNNPVEKAPTLLPYILAGHCFDYTKQIDNLNTNNFGQRRSSAIQAGIGTHFNITERFDISLVGQYMLHLGTDIHASKEDGVVSFEKESGVNLEGHLLLHVSLNYKIFDAW